MEAPSSLTDSRDSRAGVAVGLERSLPCRLGTKVPVNRWQALPLAGGWQVGGRWVAGGWQVVHLVEEKGEEGEGEK